MMVKSALAAVGIVIGFVLLATPAHADTGGISALGKTLPGPTHLSHGLSLTTSHVVKQVRHEIVRTPPARTAVRHAGKTATVTRHPVARALPLNKITRPVVHRATVSGRPALRARISGAAARASKITIPATKITTGATKITNGARGLTAGAGRTAATAGKVVTTATGRTASTTGKAVTSTTDEATAVVRAVQTGTVKTAVQQVADSGATLTKLLQPVSQTVLGTTSQLTQRATAVLVRTVATVPPAVPIGQPVKSAGGQSGSSGSPPVDHRSRPLSSSVDASGIGLMGPTAGAPSSTIDTGSVGSSWIATLTDVARHASGVFLRTGASAGGSVTAVALLTLTVGVAAAGAGSAGSGGSPSVLLALLQNGLAPAAAGASRRFAGARRQVGWRLPGRPSFSPD